MKKVTLPPLSSKVGAWVVLLGGLVLFLVLLKWAWNSFFGDILGARYLDWPHTAALFFWIVLIGVLYIGGRDVGK